MQVADALAEKLTKESENCTIEMGGWGVGGIKINAISYCAILYQERLLILLEMVTLKIHEPWWVWLSGAKHFQPQNKGRFMKIWLHAGYFDCQTYIWTSWRGTTTGSACAPGEYLGLNLHRGFCETADSVIHLWEVVPGTALPREPPQHPSSTP